MQQNYTQPTERPCFIELHDELNVSEHKKLQNLISSDEKIFFSGQVVKINERSKHQKRFLIVTNKAIYNIHPRNNVYAKIAYWFSPSSSIKRKISGWKIDAVTISTNPSSDQFVVHVNGEYDYLFDGQGKREKIVKALAQLRAALYSDQFTIYMKDEANLKNFRTTESDFKSGAQKRPKDDDLNVSRDFLGRGLSWIIQNRKQIIQHATFYKQLNQSGSGFQSGLESMHSLPDTQASGTPATASMSTPVNQAPISVSQSSFIQNQIPYTPQVFDRSQPIEKIDDITMTTSVKVQIETKPKPNEHEGEEKPFDASRPVIKFRKNNHRNTDAIPPSSAFESQVRSENPNSYPNPQIV